MVQITAVNQYGTAKWIVSPNAAQGTHTTIAGALASSSAGDTIFIRNGTYTENLTLVAGVNLTAWPSDEATIYGNNSSVIIIGKATYTGSGQVNISNVTLQTNSDFALSVTGSSASVVNLYGCSVNCTNSTGIQFTSSSSSSKIVFNNFYANLGTTGIAFFTHSSSGILLFQYGNQENSGGSTTASTCSSGAVYSTRGTFGSAWSVTGTGNTSINYSSIDTSGQNVVCLNFTSSGLTADISYCFFYSGSAAGISLGAGANLQFEFNRITTSNTNAISGTGNLQQQGNLLVGGTAQYDPGLTLSSWNLNPSNATSGYVLTSTGTNTSPTWQAATGGGSVTIEQQVFTSSGTYTPTSGMTYCEVAIVAGGGGGGGSTTTGTSLISCAGGGGGGGFSFKTLTAATIGTSKAVTVGAAGAGGSIASAGTAGGGSSLGTLVIATGGAGGAGSSVAGALSVTGGGLGGIFTAGTYGGSGNNGGAGEGWLDFAGSGIGFGGAGGSSFLSGGTSQQPCVINSSSAGATALGYGGGGSGASNVGIGAAAVGGAGAPGIVIITEYIASVIAPTSITTVTHAASPYTVLSTDYYLACQTSGGVITIKLPNAPASGRVITIKDSNGAAATSNISVTTVGGTVTIDGQTTYTMSTNYQSISVIFDGSNYEVM